MTISIAVLHDALVAQSRASGSSYVRMIPVELARVYPEIGTELFFMASRTNICWNSCMAGNLRDSFVRWLAISDMQ